MGFSIKNLGFVAMVFCAQGFFLTLQAGGMIDFDETNRPLLKQTEARVFLKHLWHSPQGEAMSQDLSDDQKKILAHLKNNLGKKLLKSDALNLGGQNISVLSSLVVGLTYLKVLDVSKNNLNTLPKEIGFLPNLVHLDASHNRIEQLPDEIGHLSTLKNLDLEDNLLTTLPHTFGSMTSLEMARLSYNNLESLPPSIGQLANLNMLVLSANNLKDLPEALGSISNLREIHLDFNEELTHKSDGFQAFFLSQVSLFMDDSGQELRGTKVPEPLTSCADPAPLPALSWVFADFFSF